jgi:glycosyltransferase 2 family protein
MNETSNPSAPSAPPSALRQALPWTIKIAVSGGLLYLLLRQNTDQLWQTMRAASFPWLALAIGLQLVILMVSTWRWRLLLRAQHLTFPFRAVLTSYMVASFFNNFLPSNIGGDVIRIGDTAKQAGSKTLATTIVLVDRGIGLLGLVFVAALGSTMAARVSEKFGPVGPGILWMLLGGAIAVATVAVLMPQTVAGALRPLRALHQEWVEERIDRLTSALSKFRDAPWSLVSGFFGAVVVQALFVGFYFMIATSLHLPIPLAHLAIVVPLSLIVQMLPISLGGLGVREATFAAYFTQLGLPRESGIALSFLGAVLIMLFSLSGAVALLTRRRAEVSAAPRPNTSA